MEQLDLSFFFKTKEQAADFSTRVANIIDRMYKNDFNAEIAIGEELGIQRKDRFIRIIKEAGIQYESIPTFKQFLENILRQIANLPILSITIAFTPTESTLTKLSEWFMLNVKKQVLFDINVDKNFIGGTAILMNGKYLDFTIRNTFSQISKDVLDKQSKPTTEKEHKTAVAQQPEYMSLGR